MMIKRVCLLCFLLPIYASAVTFFERDRHSLVTLGDITDPRTSPAVGRSLGGEWPLPASSLATPMAFGAEWKDLFVGLGVQNRARFGSQAHSTFHLGLGLGRADLIALEVAVSSYGLFRRAAPFTTGGVSLKLHRFFPDHGLAVAVGYDNAIVWSIPDSGQSLFGVVSKFFRLSEHADDNFSLLTLHAGLGDGRYRLEKETRARRETLSLFGAASLRVLPSLSFISNWTGSDLAVGLSATPLRTVPLAATLVLSDVTGMAGDGTRAALMLSYTPSLP